MAGVHGMMMMGKTAEVVFINTVDRTQASIYALMGSPTASTVYIFENTATISASTQGGWALQTGAFPAGSTLRIVNKGHIRGGGGNGGGGNGGAGGSALVLNFPTSLDNTTGTIWGGGGGGGGVAGSSGGTRIGGGGAGIPAGTGSGSASATAGGVGVKLPISEGGYRSGDGGGCGAAGGDGGGKGGGKGGRGGYSVQTNGNAVTWIAVGDRKGDVV